ncbi:hypothetical protein ACQRBG_29200 [Bacillus sp. AF56]
MWTREVIQMTLNSMYEHSKGVRVYIVNHIVEITPESIDSPDITFKQKIYVN